jgi:hypothetical protein
LEGVKGWIQTPTIVGDNDPLTIPIPDRIAKAPLSGGKVQSICFIAGKGTASSKAGILPSKPPLRTTAMTKAMVLLNLHRCGIIKDTNTDPAER